MSPARCSKTAKVSSAGVHESSMIKASPDRSTQRASSTMPSGSAFDNTCPGFHFDTPPIRHFHLTRPVCDSAAAMPPYSAGGSRQKTSICPPVGF